MSFAESSPYGLDQLHLAQQHVASDASLHNRVVLIMPALLPAETAQRFHSYGLGIAEVTLTDNTTTAQSYLIDGTTPEMQAIDQIRRMESDGVVTEGTTYRAIADLLQGTFHEQWMNDSSEPRQTD